MKKFFKCFMGIVFVSILLMALTACGSDEVSFKNAKIIDSKNASGDTIGKVSVLEIEESKITDESLVDWSTNHVQKEGLDYGIIVYKDNKLRGIYGMGNYVEKNVLLEPLADGTYTYSEDEQTEIFIVKDNELAKQN